MHNLTEVLRNLTHLVDLMNDRLIELEKKAGIESDGLGEMLKEIGDQIWRTEQEIAERFPEKE